MAKVLLFGLEGTDARKLAPRLALQGYSITECADRLDVLSRFEKRPVDCDVVLLDISYNRPKDWELLDVLCRLRAVDSLRPTIVCISRTYRGPQMRMEVERRGARLVVYGR
jgi:CheY-like chemotaxis protein